MYKKKSIPLSLKALVWNKYIGEEKGIGYCQCCRKNIIKQISFHCGHIISEKNGGSTTLNNLIPLCQTCNLSMGKQNMNDFVKKYGFHDNNSDTSNIFNNKIKNYEKIISTDLINLDNEDLQTINFLTMYFNAKKNKIE
jgi:hypothetical protein